MFKLKNLKFSTKILLLGIGGVLITVLALVAVITWQSSQFNAVAQDEFNQLVDSDLGHITDGVYHMVTAQDELVQQLVNYSLNVARQVLNNTGQVSLATDNVEWTAINQFTQQPVTIQLPKMLIGGNWLGQNTALSIETPVVDEVQRLMGGTVTIFQRMNEQGDMLRVATNVPTTDGKRAVGTYIPAIMPDGTPNPVVSTVLPGNTYRGDAFVVNAWYDTAYEPILNKAGQVIGMLYVGVKQQNVESLRQAILRTQVGKTGYVYVLGSDGNDRGHYIISQNGQRDGENVWETQDAQGNYVIQSIINKAVTLKPGETATVRYLWQNPGEPAPRWKIARIAYYAPWHWVIGSGTYEDELETYRSVLQEGQSRMIVVSGVAGLVIALVAGLLSVLLSRAIARPVGQLAHAAAQIAAGNLDVYVKVEQQDEIGTLATTFNNMTAQLTRRAAELATEAEVSTATSTILEVDKLLQEVVDLTKERFNLYHSHIYLLDEAGTNLVLAAGAGEPGRQMMAKGLSIQLDREQSLVARAARERKGVTVNDVTQAPDFLPNPLLPDTRSELAVPMIVGGNVIGVFDVQSDQVGRFTDSDINIQTTLAAQVAASIQNVRQFESTQKIAADLRVVVNVGIATSTITEAGHLLQEVVDLTQKSFNFYHAHIYLLNKAEDTLELAAGVGEVGRKMVAEGRQIPLASEQSLVARAAREGKGVTVNDVTLAPDFLPNPLLPETRSEMAVPMLAGGKVIGVLDVQSEAVNRFSETDISIQTTLASQVAVALQNARSFSQAQLQAEREAALNLITQKIQGATRIETALQIAAREIGRSVGRETHIMLDAPVQKDGRR